MRDAGMAGVRAVAQLHRRNTTQSRNRDIAVSQNCNIAVAKWRDITQSDMRTIAMLRNRSIVVAQHRATVTENSMKKHQVASELAAKLSAAANQPAGKGKSGPQAAAGDALPVPEAAPPETRATDPGPRPSKVAAKESTIVITLRPRLSLWKKCVAKAAERMREQGRAVSPQQIMLEALERTFP